MIAIFHLKWNGKQFINVKQIEQMGEIDYKNANISKDQKYEL